jgi:hypothetical protein
MATKCEKCNKKLNDLMINIYLCRCKGIYCGKHLHDHNCTFDYKELFCEQMKSATYTVENKKVAKI